MHKTVVVALGGNAILRPRQNGTPEQQLANLAAACERVAGLIAAGYRVVLTHGNGPQVGNILIQNEEASTVVPPMPLDVCGAQSQGMIGYWVQQQLGNVLRRQGLERPVVTLVTQVQVDPADPAFARPTKPVGPFYTPDKARRMMTRKGWQMHEDANRGWRRVVPSPEPVAIVEGEVIRQLVETGCVVICNGGGGVPVAAGAAGQLAGSEAVIDKDLAGQRLATDLGAEAYMMLTDVEHVALNFGRPEQVNLGRITPAEARRYMQAGHFRAGSMAPKVEAAIRFVEKGGEMAVITSLENAAAAISGQVGTVIAAS